MAVDWTTAFIEFVQANGHERFDATPEAEAEWTEHVKQMYSAMLMRKAKGWFTGYNSNIEGHEHGRTRYFVYNGGQPKFLKRITEVATNGYQGVAFS